MPLLDLSIYFEMAMSTTELLLISLSRSIPESRLVVSPIGGSPLTVLMKVTFFLLSSFVVLGASSCQRFPHPVPVLTPLLGNAKQLGLNFAPKLRFAAQANSTNDLSGAEQLNIVNNTIAGRKGMVDFSPVRKIVPGDSSPFPPKSVQPGSVGDKFYTPFIQVMNGGGEVYNAPIVAGDVTEDYLNKFCDGIPDNMKDDFRSKVHDQVLSICPQDSIVTLATIRGFSFSKSVLYLIADGSDPLPATLDGGTYAPRLGNVKTGGDDALFSGVERFFVNTNGFTNKDIPSGGLNNETHHPWRQGLNSAILGEGNPLNILGAIPSVAYDYSPLWDFNLYAWTNFSIENGIRTRLTGEFEVLGMAAAGYVTNPDGTPLSDAGIVNNCPIVHRFL